MNENNRMNLAHHQPLNLMGFDYGTRSIGVAVGQTKTKTARALGAIKVNYGVSHWKKISKLVQEWAPQAFIVGIPLDMNDQPFSIIPMVYDFIDQLKKRFHLPLYTVDERLTSKEARAQLFEQYGYRGLQKEKVDAKSAEIILESWMNSISLIESLHN